MKRSIILLFIFFTVLQKVESIVTSTGPIPSDAVEIYVSEKYTCELWQAGSPLYRAATEMGSSIAVPWIDVAAYINDVHLAQGFVDILLTVDISTASLSADVTAEWYINGDSDIQDEWDIKSSCDGIIYDLIDRDFKTVSETNILGTNAKNGEYIVMRFGLPEKIYKDYKIYLGAGSVNAFKSVNSYSDSYQVKLYICPLSSGPYACADISDVSKKYEKEYDSVNKVWKTATLKRYAVINTPVQFDNSRSTDTLGREIVKYQWDFGDGGDEVLGPSPIHIYRTAGEYTVKLTVTNEDGSVSATDGSNRVSVSTAPLPLYLTVLNSGLINEGALYQNGPNPFIPSKYPKTTINYEINQPSHVTIKIYTISGQLVKKLVDEDKPPGYWSVEWYGKNDDDENVASGIYFYHMNTGGFNATKKMVVIQ